MKRDDYSPQTTKGPAPSETLARMVEPGESDVHDACLCWSNLALALRQVGNRSHQASTGWSW